MKHVLVFAILLLYYSSLTAQPSNYKCNVIAYCYGDTTGLTKFDISPVTHLMFSFCHLKNGKINVDSHEDSVTIEKMVSLKQIHRSLKVMLSIGGWEGCEYCSETFSKDSSRIIFAKSVKHLIDYFNADGIDLDWEYPAIAGSPNQQYLPADKKNFTALVKSLRKDLGNEKEISFATGCFKEYFDSSIEWDKVMPIVNRLNLMSYDFVTGNETTSGHHTALFSTSKQKELSVDYGVKYLDSIGVPLRKIAIGAAFYGRIFKNTTTSNDGLNEPTNFKKEISYKKIEEQLMKDSNYIYHWDSIAHAPYLYNPKDTTFTTFDDAASITEKTKYVIDKKLNGIMFWELKEDDPAKSLLFVIQNEIKLLKK